VIGIPGASFVSNRSGKPRETERDRVGTSDADGDERADLETVCHYVEKPPCGQSDQFTADTNEGRERPDSPECGHPPPPLLGDRGGDGDGNYPNGDDEGRFVSRVSGVQRKHTSPDARDRHNVFRLYIRTVRGRTIYSPSPPTSRMTRLPGIDPPDRVVCHVDLDCFYAACERRRRPELAGVPIVVGMGYEPGESHGAVATASYEARTAGVESAMSIEEALELLPRREADGTDRADKTGVYLPVDMPYYESVSEEVRSVLRSIGGTVRNVSIDEAYLDPGAVEWGEARSFGRALKGRIDAETGLTASVGIAPDMTTAKLASDREKPDGLVVVEPDDVDRFLEPIAVEELHGVGPVTAAELRSMGFETAGEIADADVRTFVDAFGERGRRIHEQARGEDSRVVEPKGNSKSLSSESAFREPTADPDVKRGKVTGLVGDVTERAATEGILYRTIGIKVVRPPYDVNTRAESLPGPVDDPEIVEAVALDLLEEFEADPVRKLGVRLSKLSFDDRDQATFDEWATDRPADGDAPTRRIYRGQTRLSRFE